MSKLRLITMLPPQVSVGAPLQELVLLPLRVRAAPLLSSLPQKLRKGQADQHQPEGGQAEL